jgi:hypothetical protein
MAGKSISTSGEAMKLVRAVSIIRRHLLCKYGSRAGPPKAEPDLAKVECEAGDRGRPVRMMID